MDLGERLTEKWGALPVWAWGAIVAVVALAGYYFIAGRGTRDGGTVVPSARLDSTGYQTSGIQGGNNVTTDTTVPESNIGWLNRVSRIVASALSVSPSAVYGALQKYLAGMELTTQEKGWVDEAINRGMNPPEGTQGISPVIPDAVTPAPVTPPPAAAPKVVGYISTTTPKGTFGTSKGAGLFGEVSQLLSDGTRRAVTAAGYKSLGSPKHKAVSPSSYFSHKQVGVI